MRKAVIAFVALLLAGSTHARKPQTRPPILGIAFVRVRSTNLDLSISFFKTVLGFYSAQHCRNTSLVCLAVGGQQFIQLDPVQGHLPGNFVEEVGFLTSDVSAMRKFLISQGLRPGRLETHGYSSSSSTVTGPGVSHTDFRNEYSSVGVSDPEGNRVVFVQHDGGMYFLDYDPRVGKHIIHAGFVVRDRAAEDKFYKDILGFHLYWQGGRKDDGTDWVNMQVPDGTDWIEYMLNVPADAERHTLGVMNHIALGVPDIHTAEAQLHKNGWTGTEEPKIGRGGKWQLNLYDPDDTRIELMEFTPVQKPCCSEYTGPHPKP
jgi:catechol 2,3-dioxygenase-like lactoylglutathione lyase family enzyme